MIVKQKSFMNSYLITAAASIGFSPATTHQDAVKSTTTNFSLDCSINSIHSPSDSTYFTMLLVDVPFDDDDLLPIRR
jgi:hypothetical protein